MSAPTDASVTKIAGLDYAGSKENAYDAFEAMCFDNGSGSLVRYNIESAFRLVGSDGQTFILYIFVSI